MEQDHEEPPETAPEEEQQESSEKAPEEQAESSEKAPEEQQESSETAPGEEQQESSETAPEDGHATSDDELSDDGSDVSSDFETSDLSPESLTGQRFYDAVKSYCGTDNTSVHITGEYDQCCKQKTTSNAAFGIRFKPRPDTEDIRCVSLVQGEWTIHDREANCWRTGVFENGLLVSERQPAGQAEAWWVVPLRHANKTLWVMGSDGPKCVIGGGDKRRICVGEAFWPLRKNVNHVGFLQGIRMLRNYTGWETLRLGKVVTERGGHTLETTGTFDECYRKLHAQNCSWKMKDGKTKDGPLEFHAYDPEEEPRQ